MGEGSGETCHRWDRHYVTLCAKSAEPGGFRALHCRFQARTERRRLGVHPLQPVVTGHANAMVAIHNEVEVVNLLHVDRRQFVAAFERPTDAFPPGPRPLAPNTESGWPAPPAGGVGAAPGGDLAFVAYGKLPHRRRLHGPDRPHPHRATQERSFDGKRIVSLGVLCSRSNLPPRGVLCRARPAPCGSS